MTKEEYLEDLPLALKNLPVSDIEENVTDYDEHIQVAVERGENEKSRPSRRNYTKVLLAALGLGLFNLVIVLGPFIGIWSVLIGLFISGTALVLSGIIAVFVILLIPTGLASGLSGTILDVTALIGIGSTLGSVGLLTMLCIAIASKKFHHMSLKYLDLNIQLLTGK